MKGPAYTEAELDTLARMYVEGASWEAMVATLGRTRKSISVRLVDLRRERKIAPRPKVYPSFAERTAQIDLSRAIRLDGDDKLVRLTLAEGGFPRAVVTPRGTVWVGPDGKGWRHYTVQRRGSVRRAA